MIIDAHNHADWLWRPYDKVIENMDRYNIDVSWLLSCERPENEIFMPEMVASSSIGVKDQDAPFEKCINYYEKNPNRFVLGFAPDPRLPNALNRLKVAMSFYNAKIVGEFKFRMMIDNYDAIEMFRYAGENGMPVVLHLEEPTVHAYYKGNTIPRATYWYGGGIDALERVLKLCPNTMFLGHAPGFWNYYLVENSNQATKSDCKYVRGKVLDLLDNNKNLYCDISAGSGLTALKKDSAFTKKFITDYCDRILYGRDCYDNAHQEFINSLGLCQEVKDRIYFKNALELVPLNHRKVPLNTEEFWDLPE